MQQGETPSTPRVDISRLRVVKVTPHPDLIEIYLQDRNAIPIFVHESVKEYAKDLQTYSDEQATQHKQLEILEQSDLAKTWASRWIAVPIAYLFPKDTREEWLGDLIEVNQELLHKQYPRWLVNAVNVGRTLILISSAIKIRLSDFFSSGRQRSE